MLFKSNKKDIKDITVVLMGPGAAGTAIIKMMHTAGVGKTIQWDEFGILYKDRQEGLILISVLYVILLILIICKVH